MNTGHRPNPNVINPIGKLYLSPTPDDEIKSKIGILMANYRSEKLKRAVASLPCQVCGIQGWTQASHSNQLRDGKGMGIKAHDYRLAAICVECHAEIDQGSTMSRAERDEQWEEAHRKTIGLLFECGLLEVK